MMKTKVPLVFAVACPVPDAARLLLNANFFSARQFTVDVPILSLIKKRSIFRRAIMSLSCCSIHGRSRLGEFSTTILIWRRLFVESRILHTILRLGGSEDEAFIQIYCVSLEHRRAVLVTIFGSYKAIIIRYRYERFTFSRLGDILFFLAPTCTFSYIKKT